MTIHDTGPIPLPAQTDPTLLGIHGWAPVCDMAVTGPRKPATAAMLIRCPAGHVEVDLLCTYHSSIMREVTAQMTDGGRCPTCTRPTVIEVRDL